MFYRLEKVYFVLAIVIAFNYNPGSGSNNSGFFFNSKTNLGHLGNLLKFIYNFKSEEIILNYSFVIRLHFLIARSK
jgi:hypothetical protein